ncbi:hypothetical protein ACFY3E_03225 [Streptomyces griseorubiginosus]|uniref:hypothetical protein n=1 Tax=Streptomyces griseorubiginosus TaxID=67304 RepID=UPI00367DBB04
MAAATETYIHLGLAAIAEHLTGSSGPDPFDLEAGVIHRATTSRGIILRGLA